MNFAFRSPSARILRAAALGACLLIAACGGRGGGASSDGLADSTSASPSNLSSSTTTGTNSVSSTGTSSSSSSFNSNIVWPATTASPGQILAVSADGTIAANSVLTFGQVFSAGEITAGVQAVTTSGVVLPTQINVKRTHPDGSVRHAIVSVQLPATSGSLAFSLQPSTSASSGSGITLAQALAGPVDYSVEIDEIGSTPEAGKTWATTLKTALGNSPSVWFAGPLATEWRSRVAPTSGSSSHPALRVLFDTRYANATQGRVSIAIENIESTASRGDRTYNLRIKDSNGTVIYSLSNQTHYAQTRYRNIFYFGGAKAMMAIVDIERLKNSRAVPNYANIGSLPEISSGVDDEVTNWNSSHTYRGMYQSGLQVARMPNSGGRGDIGPLPSWIALALLSRDSRAYQIMFDTAERASYYGIHYAAANTGSVLSIVDNPNVSLDYRIIGTSLPATTLTSTNASNPDGSPLEPDPAHEPSMTYLPYVITGDQYYLDELYYWAGYNILVQFPDIRGYTQGLIYLNQLRGQAWTLRSIGEAAFIAPDAHWQKNYFTNIVNNNITYYINNTMPSNSLGMWNTWQDYSGPTIVPDMSTQTCQMLPPWEHSYMTFTLQQLTDWGFSNAQPLRNWAQGFTVKLFSSEPAFRALDGASYLIAVSVQNNGTCTSPTALTDMASIYAYTFANRATLPTQVTDYNATGGSAINALATLAMSIDAGITNSNQAYIFLQNQLMSNPLVTRQTFVKDPTWNIVPRGSIVGLGVAPGIYP